MCLTQPTLAAQHHVFGLSSLVFSVLMVLVNIILLNMLIALMSDTWSRNCTPEKRQELLLKGRGQLLLEFESRMSDSQLDNKKWFPHWLHIIKKVVEK